jgi:hypothetical protein
MMRGSCMASSTLCTKASLVCGAMVGSVGSAGVGCDSVCAGVTVTVTAGSVFAFFLALHSADRSAPGFPPLFLLPVSAAAGCGGVWVFSAIAEFGEVGGEGGVVGGTGLAQWVGATWLEGVVAGGASGGVLGGGAAAAAAGWCGCATLISPVACGASASSSSSASSWSCCGTSVSYSPRGRTLVGS